MKRIATLLVAIALSLTILGSSFFTVDEAEYAVITQFGSPVRTLETAGLHRKLPWQTVGRLDRRMQLYETPLIEYLTGDKKNVVLQTFVCWRVENALEFFRAVRTFESARQKIDDLTCAAIGATLGDHTMSDLISSDPGQVKIREMERRVTSEVNAKTQDGYGIAVARVGISRLALPADNAESVYRRMEAERSAIATEYRALGKEEAQKIRSQADREKSDIIANAYKEAEIIRGEGDATAAEIYAKAYSKAPEFFKLLRTLEAYKKMLAQRAVIVMSADSELLRYLNGAFPSETATAGGQK